MAITQTVFTNSRHYFVNKRYMQGCLYTRTPLGPLLPQQDDDEARYQRGGEKGEQQVAYIGPVTIFSSISYHEAQANPYDSSNNFHRYSSFIHLLNR